MISGAGLCWQHVGGVGSTTTTTTTETVEVKGWSLEIGPVSVWSYLTLHLQRLPSFGN